MAGQKTSKTPQYKIVGTVERLVLDVGGSVAVLNLVPNAEYSACPSGDGGQKYALFVEVDDYGDLVENADPKCRAYDKHLRFLGTDFKVFAISKQVGLIVEFDMKKDCKDNKDIQLKKIELFP